MIPLIFRIVMVFVVLTIAYVALAAWSRFKHRRQLIEQFEALPPTEQALHDRDAYIAVGMKAYDRSLKPKLILGVYIVPGAILGLLVYLAQYT